MKTTITYFNDGSKKEKNDIGVETWYDPSGNIHRADGPAITFSYTDYDMNHKSKTYLQRIVKGKNTWYWHGVKVDASSQEQFQNLVKFIAFL